jgi:hypothetical protein
VTLSPEAKAVLGSEAPDVSRRPPFLGVKLALAVPSYGPLDPHIDKHLRAAVMTASNAGIRWAGDVSSIRMGWEAGRDIAAKAAIDADADGVLWVDDDILLPADAFIRLVAHGKDFTSGMYFQKPPPHWPLVAMFDGKSFQWLAEYPDTKQLVEVDGVGFGCAFTSTKLLRTLKARHGKIFEWTDFSEDFTFCLRAGEAGMKPWVDTTIKCGHSPLEPTFVTEEDFQRVRESANGNLQDRGRDGEGSLPPAPAAVGG